MAKHEGFSPWALYFTLSAFLLALMLVAGFLETVTEMYAATIIAASARGVLWSWVVQLGLFLFLPGILLVVCGELASIYTKWFHALREGGDPNPILGLFARRFGP